MFIAKRQIEVEWGHCDPAGIVFNPRFFEWFDFCANGLFGQAGLRKVDLVKTYGIVGIPLVATRAKFIKPSKFGDIVSIETSITEFKRTSFDVSHRLFNGGELAVEGFETRVWAARHPDDPSRLKAVPIPAAVIALFG